MSYKSPIEITTDLTNAFMLECENEVVKAVYRIGVNVDKDELLRALAYDREQYKAGYEDGLADATMDAIPVDWIRKQAFNHPYLSRNLFYQMIIEEWRKENEQREDR